MSPIKKHKSARLAGYFFVVYYLVGLAGLSIPHTREIFTRLVPVSILLSTAILLFFHRQWRRSDGAVLLLIAITGYLIEVLGVLTGHVFGSYAYGATLGPKVFETPLIIGINWMMLIYCVFAIMEPARLFWPLKVLSGAVLMVAYDVVLEPVAIRLDMWNWAGGEIPLQNYQAWFIISVIFLSFMQLAGVRTHNRAAPWLFGIQFLFFLLLNIGLRI